MVAPKQSSNQWIKVQQKAFVRWINIQFENSNDKVINACKISSLERDLKDGVHLNYLLRELLKGKYSLGFTARPRFKIHSIDNISCVLNYLHSSKNLQLHNIGAEDIYEGNLKLILGLIWALILNFTLSSLNETSDLNAIKKTLLRWCQDQVKIYGGMVHITDFSTSWNNGVALSGLLSSLRPDLIDFYGIDMTDKEGNTRKAISLATSELAIPQLVDCEDLLVARPDEKVVLTYLIGWYEKFNGSMPAHSKPATPQASPVVDAVNLKTKRTSNESELSSYLCSRSNSIARSESTTSKASFKLNPTENWLNKLVSGKTASMSSDSVSSIGSVSASEIHVPKRNMRRTRRARPSPMVEVDNDDSEIYESYNVIGQSDNTVDFATQMNTTYDSVDAYYDEESSKSSKTNLREIMSQLAKIFALKNAYEKGAKVLLSNINTQIYKWTNLVSHNELYDLEELEYERLFLKTNFQNTKQTLSGEKLSLASLHYKITFLLKQVNPEFAYKAPHGFSLETLEAEWSNLCKEELKYSRLIELKLHTLKKSLKENFQDTLTVFNQKLTKLKQYFGDSHKHLELLGMISNLKSLLTNAEGLYESCTRYNIDTCDLTVDGGLSLNYNELILETNNLKKLVTEALNFEKDCLPTFAEPVSAEDIADMFSNSAKSGSYITKKEFRSQVLYDAETKAFSKKIECYLPIHKSKLGYDYKGFVDLVREFSSLPAASKQEDLYESPLIFQRTSSNYGDNSPFLSGSEDSCLSVNSSPRMAANMSLFGSPATVYDETSYESPTPSKNSRGKRYAFPSNIKNHTKLVFPMDVNIVMEEQL